MIADDFNDRIEVSDLGWLFDGILIIVLDGVCELRSEFWIIVIFFIFLNVWF